MLREMAVTNPRRSRWVERCAALVLASVVGACAPDGGATVEQRARADSVVVGGRRVGATAEPEWERNFTHEDGATLHPVAFRAGAGLAATIHGPSRSHWKFFLARRGHPGSGGRHVVELQGFRPSIWNRTDIVGIASDGRVWYLDRETGSVVSEDVGAFGELIARLGARGTVRSGWALGERAIAFVDDAQPWRVLVRDLGSAAPTRTVPLDAIDSTGLPWASLRFGGSPDGGCVLWSPRLDGILVVSDSLVRALGPLVEPPPLAPPTPRNPWYARLLGHEAPPAPAARPGALDATTFAGGVAVLYAGQTPEAERLVDLYAEDGAYQETMRLPRRALRIASTAGRLITIETERDSVFIASYVLPARVRVRPLADEPSVIAPDIKTGALVLPADSARR
jgi:hypothetical protein